MSSGSEVTPPQPELPMNEQVRPSTLATDRSISPVTTTSVIGSAISTIGMTRASTNRQNRGLAKPSIVAAPMTATRTSATRTMHVPRCEHRADPRRRRVVAGAGRVDHLMSAIAASFRAAVGGRR